MKCENESRDESTTSLLATVKRLFDRATIVKFIIMNEKIFHRIIKTY